MLPNFQVYFYLEYQLSLHNLKYFRIPRNIYGMRKTWNRCHIAIFYLN